MRFVVLPRFIDHNAVPGLATATPVAVDERHYVLKLPQPPGPEAWAVTDWTEAPPGAVPPLGASPDTTFVEGLASSDACEGRASVRNLIVRPGEVSLDIEAPCDAVVVVAQGYHAGWLARVDGAEAAVHPADHAFVGVPVVAGTHRVELEWVDASTRLVCGGLRRLRRCSDVRAVGRRGTPRIVLSAHSGSDVERDVRLEEAERAA